MLSPSWNINVGCSRIVQKRALSEEALTQFAIYGGTESWGDIPLPRASRRFHKILPNLGLILELRTSSVPFPKT